MTKKICHARLLRENKAENPLSCMCSKTNASVLHFLHHKFTLKQVFLAIGNVTIVVVHHKQPDDLLVPLSQKFRQPGTVGSIVAEGSIHEDGIEQAIEVDQLFTRRNETALR